MHGHPSGDPTPSDQDRSVTKQLLRAGKLLGIQVLDDVIVGDPEFYSFCEAGALKSAHRVGKKVGTSKDAAGKGARL